MTKLTPPQKWFAIYTRSRFEKKIFNALQQSGFETFLPLIKVKRVWSDRLKTIQIPLLSSYVFIRISETQCPLCYYYPGFVKFVSSEGKPCEIKEKEINFLRKVVTSGFEVEQSPACEVGEYVKIIRGPLKGWEGKISGKRGHSRIVFQFDSIQQAIGVEVPLSDIEVVR